MDKKLIVVGRCWHCNHPIFKSDLFVYNDELRKKSINRIKEPKIIGVCGYCNSLIDVNDLDDNTVLKFTAKELNLMLR